jgi:endonuclease YncB( thermonuclease family)
MVQANYALTSDLPEGAIIRIVDADTIAVDGLPNKIRLDGIDAPEDGQACIDGQKVRLREVATAALTRLFYRGDVWSEVGTGGNPGGSPVVHVQLYERGFDGGVGGSECGARGWRESKC